MEFLGGLFNSLVDNYADYEYFVATAQLFLAMLGMGALLAPRDFLLEIKRPQGLLMGLGMQWLLVPLVAFILGLLLPVPAGIGIGLVLIAVVPGGTLSNILTLFGRGNIALSVSLTSITTVAALVTTPLLLGVLADQYLPDNFRMPAGRIALDILVALIIPLLIGMLVHYRLGGAFAARFSKITIRVSLLLIVIMTIGAGGSGRLDPQTYGPWALVGLFLFCLGIQLVALIAGLLTKLRAADITAIVIEGGFRNISLAVAVKATVFPAKPGELDPIGDAALFVLLLYGGVSLLMCLIPVFLNRRISAARDGNTASTAD